MSKDLARPSKQQTRAAGSALGAILVVASAVCVGAVPSCSHDSYLKVTLLSADGEIADISRVVVSVHDQKSMSSAWLEYMSSKTISIDTTVSKTLSISFTPSESGIMQLDVGILNPAAACLGRGTATATIKKGDVSSVQVVIVRTSVCPVASDGGVGDGGPSRDSGSDVITFPGCDPANPAAMCDGNQTCFVNCATSKGTCIPAGTKGPGDTCATNSDCIAGTQCFDYSGLPGCGAGTKICQKFCNNDSQCATTSTTTGAGGTTGGGMPGAAVGGSGGAGGASESGGGGQAGTAGATGAGGSKAAAGASGAAGAGTSPGGTGGQGPATTGTATCRNPVVCSANVTTSYRTCSFACDPRGDATVGCPRGLQCFLYKDPSNGQDSPDCGCREPSRSRTDGMTCSSSTDCAPGFICNLMGGTQVCRKLCQITSPTDCAAPKTCNALTNTAFGVCVAG